MFDGGLQASWCALLCICVYFLCGSVCAHTTVCGCVPAVCQTCRFLQTKCFFPLPPPLFVVVVVTMAPAYFGPADHLLRIAKLLPPCHYGDTGCYTSANQCGVEDVKKLPGFLFITWKVNPCFCVSSFISVVCVSCNITVGKNRRLEWKEKPQQTILSIVKNKTCHMPHTSPTVYEKKVPWVFPKDQKPWMTPWKTTCMSVKCTGSHSGKAGAWPGGYMSQGHKLLACNLKNVKNEIK